MNLRLREYGATQRKSSSARSATPPSAREGHASSSDNGAAIHQTYEVLLPIVAGFNDSGGWRHAGRGFTPCSPTFYSTFPFISDVRTVTYDGSGDLYARSFRGGKNSVWLPKVDQPSCNLTYRKTGQMAGTAQIW
jgi:hypothetical protein